MDKTLKLVGEVLRWVFMGIGALLFVFGLGAGRWDWAVVGLLFIQFSMAISIGRYHV